MPSDSQLPSFSALTAEHLEEFARIRQFVSGLADSLLGGKSLDNTQTDLSMLQAIVNHEDMRHADYGAWVALGIAFGDALISCVPGLAWRLVSDESGTHAALQYRSKAMSISAPTMLWKRAERGEEMDLAHIAQEISAFLEENGDEYADA